METRKTLQSFIEELNQKINVIKNDRNYKLFGVSYAKELEALKTLFEKKQNGEVVDVNKPVVINDYYKEATASFPIDTYEISYLEIARNLRIEYLKYLLELDAKPDDKLVENFLKYRKDKDANFEEIEPKLALLKAYHAKFSSLDSEQHTPLYNAQFNRQFKVAELLQRYGASKTFNEKLTLPLNRFKKEIDEGFTDLVMRFSPPH